MFCSYCGAENPEFVSLCRSCAQKQPAVDTEDPAQQNAPLPQIQYSQFIFRLLVGLFLLAAAVFDFCQLAMQHSPGASFIRPLAICLAALCVLYLARSSWMAILFREPASDNKTRTKHKRTIMCAVVVGILLVSGAALFGWLIGKDRHQLQVLERDLDVYVDAGDRISKARNNPGKTVSDVVEMYETLENDASVLNNNSSNLMRELLEYDNEFPEFHAQTQKSIQNVTLTYRRMLLLQKQIAVARKMKSLVASEQITVWNSEMLPLLKQEEELDATVPRH